MTHRLILEIRLYNNKKKNSFTHYMLCLTKELYIDLVAVCNFVNV